MTTLDFLALIIGCPIIGAIGAYLGRKFQRYHWHLDLPYEERVKLLHRRA